MSNRQQQPELEEGPAEASRHAHGHQQGARRFALRGPSTRVFCLALLTLAGSSLAQVEPIPSVDLDSFEHAIDLCDLDSARQHLSVIQESSEPVFETSFAQGLLALAEDRLEDAVQAFTLATTQQPRADAPRLLSRAWFHLGEGYGRTARSSGLLAQAGLAKQARSSFEKAVEIDPDNLQARRNLVEFYSRAPGFMGGGKDKALVQVEEIKARNPARGAEALGLHHRWQGPIDEALAAYDQALALRSDWATPHYEAGLALQQAKRREAAVERFAQALDIDPAFRLAQFELGAEVARAELELPANRLTRSAEALQSYLERPACGEDPETVEALLHLATLQERLNLRGEARKSYERLLELDPTSKAAKRSLARLALER